jgi:hypothetical protein
MTWSDEPTEEQVVEAAKAWMSWQFPNRDWDEAVPVMQEKFKDGARRSLKAALAVTKRSVRGCA